MAEGNLGRLEVICGPMFSGKSTELIRRLNDAADAGEAVLAVKSALDDRYHPTAVTTHDGKSLPGVTIREPGELLTLDWSSASDGGKGECGGGSVLGLDEAHFYEGGLHDAVMGLLARGVRVILAGLDRTSMNEPFGEMGRLMVEADEVIKLAGECAVCGRAAVHTIRLFDSKESIVVGGEGMFENRCRVHLER